MKNLILLSLVLLLFACQEQEIPQPIFQTETVESVVNADTAIIEEWFSIHYSQSNLKYWRVERPVNYFVLVVVNGQIQSEWCKDGEIMYTQIYEGSEGNEGDNVEVFERNGYEMDLIWSGQLSRDLNMKNN